MIEIKSWLTREIILSVEAENLTGADLTGADLTGAKGEFMFNFGIKLKVIN